ncbi:hypothetical protein ACFX19_045214 [Malus domestica]
MTAETVFIAKTLQGAPHQMYLVYPASRPASSRFLESGVPLETPTFRTVNTAPEIRKQILPHLTHPEPHDLLSSNTNFRAPRLSREIRINPRKTGRAGERRHRLILSQGLPQPIACAAHRRDESLLIYCKPVELYNILRPRALHNPLFLRRCLHYKIQARRTQRSRAAIVIFNYRDYNNTLRKTEVTEDFSCPFCLMQCAKLQVARAQDDNHRFLRGFKQKEFGAVQHLSATLIRC